jgi:hypothetical protein
MRKHTHWLTSTLAAVLIACPALAPARDSGSGWSYTIENGVERSARTYLLVADAGQNSQRSVRVHSSCRKPRDTEGAYGKCEHTVSVESAQHEFRLDSGEDVVVVGAKWGAPLLLATLEYGCCGGPWTARLYDDQGKYLGLTQGFDTTAIGNNAITRSFDFHNRTISLAGVETLLVLGEKSDDRLRAAHAITFEHGRRSTHAVHLPLADLGTCADWVVAAFDAFADRSDILLKLEGGPCEVPEKVFSCTWKDDALDCTPAAKS